MSYCVNCGVELDGALEECPLCNTPVINPRELSKQKKPSPFPAENGAVETIRRKDLGILTTSILGATAVACGLLNLLVFTGVAWSLAVIGACLLVWVMMIPLVIDSHQPIYLSLLFDGVAAGLYLFMLSFLTSGVDVGAGASYCTPGDGHSGTAHGVYPKPAKFLFDQCPVCGKCGGPAMSGPGDSDRFVCN